MLCDVLLPLVWITLCQTDETLAAFAPQDLRYHEDRFGLSLRVTGRKQIALETDCRQVTAKLTVPYPWFAVRPLQDLPKPCAMPEPDWLADVQRAKIVEVAGNVLTLTTDDGTIWTFRAP